MKNNNKIYSTELDDLQELRESASGGVKKNIQKKIDDIFFKNPIRKKKKKKQHKITNPDDMWYY
jgi:hypothetical protein